MTSIKDESNGPQRIIVGSTQEGYVILEFEHATRWIGMCPDGARDLAESLLEMADAAENVLKNKVEH